MLCSFSGYFSISLCHWCSTARYNMHRTELVSFALLGDYCDSFSYRFTSSTTESSRHYSFVYCFFSILDDLSFRNSS